MATNFYAPTENAIEFISNEDFMTVTISDVKLANRIKALAKKFPDLVTIHASGPKNGGYIYAMLPVDFLQIRPPAAQPRKTDEQIEEARKRMKRINDAKASNA